MEIMNIRLLKDGQVTGVSGRKKGIVEQAKMKRKCLHLQEHLVLKECINVKNCGLWLQKVQPRAT
jgi:hypothetical protein